MRDVLLAAQPTKQFVEVSEVAALAAFLCSDEARSITGTMPAGRRRLDRALGRASCARKTILELPSMPAAGPSYPAGPYRFVDREYMVITYETDPEVIREQLPEPLEPLDQPLVHYEWIKMPDSSGFGSYTESGIVIPCRFGGEEVNFVSQMYLDDDPPIAAGREIWGFPEEIRPSQARDRQGHADRHARICRPARRDGHDGLQARSAWPATASARPRRCPRRRSISSSSPASMASRRSASSSPITSPTSR